MSELIENLTKDEISRIEKGEKLTLKLNEREVKIGLEDVSIKTSDAKGWVVASEGNLTVALDIKIDNKLKLEGLSRELVNRLQIIRKEAGLDVTDKIHVTFTKSDELLSIFAQNKNYIKISIALGNLISYFSEIGASAGAGDRDHVVASQSYYCYNQQQNPHTPNVMKSLGLDEADVEKFCTDMLFPKLA